MFWKLVITMIVSGYFVYDFGLTFIKLLKNEKQMHTFIQTYAAKKYSHTKIYLLFVSVVCLACIATVVYAEHLIKMNHYYYRLTNVLLVVYFVSFMMKVKLREVIAVSKDGFFYNGKKYDFQKMQTDLSAMEIKYLTTIRFHDGGHCDLTPWSANILREYQCDNFSKE